MYGQNFVQIFEIPEYIPESGSEQEFEEPEESEFKYIYDSPELKVKLAKGNFTHILSSPKNLACKGYENCYEGSKANNQLCLPTFNYKGIGEILKLSFLAKVLRFKKRRLTQTNSGNPQVVK